MRVAELYRHYRHRQQELAQSTDSIGRFRADIGALVSELNADIERLDALERSDLCRDLGEQFEYELQHAEDGRRRDVTGALLKAIEEIEHRHRLH